MKLNLGLFSKVMLPLAVTALLASLALADIAKRQASIMALSGDVRHAAGGGSAFEPAVAHAKLNEGDVLKTGPASHVDIDLGANVGIVQVAPNSTFVLRTAKATGTRAETVTETDLDLKGGKLYFKVNKLAKASRFEITTPKGIAGIRGTAGSMDADGQMIITEGMAGVAYPNNGGADTFIVHDGETVGPTDRPPHPASAEAQRDVVEALSDAASHGTGVETPPFADSVEPFISPVLPGK